MNFLKNFKLTILYKKKLGHAKITKENLFYINFFLNKNILLTNKKINNFFEFEINNNLVIRDLELNFYSNKNKNLIFNKNKIKKKYGYSNTLFLFKTNNGLELTKNLIKEKKGGLLLMSISI